MCLMFCKVLAVKKSKKNLALYFSSQAVYVTAILPYIVLAIFLIRGLTLKGAQNGIKFLFTPDVCLRSLPLKNNNTSIIPSLTADSLPCCNAAGEWTAQPCHLAGRWSPGLLLLWFGLGWPYLFLQLQFCPVGGALVLQESWNKKDMPWPILKSIQFDCLFLATSNNCVQDAVILSIVTGLTSIYAATVTYSIIGFRATEKYDSCFSRWAPFHPSMLEILILSYISHKNRRSNLRFLCDSFSWRCYVV